MPRKKTKHSHILNEGVRKTTLNKRLDALFKKANELSILCGVQIFFIIHNLIDNNYTLWPSQDEATAGLTRFLSTPEHERLRKMVVHEKYLTGAVNDIAQKLNKLQIKNNENEMQCIVNQIVNGKNVNELDKKESKDMYLFIEEKLKKLQKRRDEIDEEEIRVRAIEGSSGGLIEKTPIEGGDCGLIDESELPDDLNQVWPHIFSP